MIAAEKTGRRACLIEIDPRYVGVTIKRWQNLTRRTAVLALAAADMTLRRDVAFVLTLPFLGAALLGFREFAIERVDMVLGSVGSQRRN